MYVLRRKYDECIRLCQGKPPVKGSQEDKLCKELAHELHVILHHVPIDDSPYTFPDEVEITKFSEMIGLNLEYYYDCIECNNSQKKTKK